MTELSPRADPQEVARVQEATIVHLQEENRLLNLMSQEDATELKKLRDEVQCVEAEKHRLLGTIEAQQRQIRSVEAREVELQQAVLEAQVAVKTAERQHVSLEKADEDRKLLSQQADMDMETIRVLQKSLHEAMYERDHLATQLPKIKEERDDALAECELLEKHAGELRASNVELASRNQELQELVQRFEEEDYAQWFTRKSQRDIRLAKEKKEAKIANGESNSHQKSPSTSPEPSPSTGVNVGKPSPAATPGKSALRSTSKLEASERVYGAGGSPAGGEPPLRRKTSFEDEADGSMRRHQHGRAGQQRHGGNGLVVRDALSGAPVPDQDSEALYLSPTKYSDSDDDDLNSGETTPASGMTAAGAPFKTVRNSRRLNGQQQPSEPVVVPSTVMDEDPAVKRPKTSPLVVEAIYGEKGESDRKMYLVKYVSVEAEQWTSAAFIEQDCEALILWQRSKARDRRGLS